MFYSLAEWLCWRLASLTIGTRRKLGSLVRSASTIVKALGTRTPATGISGASNFSSAPGALSAVSLDPTLPARVNSYIEPGASIFVTGILGVSGEPPELAV